MQPQKPATTSPPAINSAASPASASRWKPWLGMITLFLGGVLLPGFLAIQAGFQAWSAYTLRADGTTAVAQVRQVQERNQAFRGPGGRASTQDVYTFTYTYAVDEHVYEAEGRLSSSQAASILDLGVVKVLYDPQNPQRSIPDVEIGQIVADQAGFAGFMAVLSIFFTVLVAWGVSDLRSHPPQVS